MYGNLFITNKIEDARLCQNAIVLTDDVEKWRYTGWLTCGILLPPYEALSEHINGNFQAVEAIYVNSLNHDSRQSLISVIIAALRLGKDICFLIPEDEEIDKLFIQILVGYFANQYGIIIGDGIGLGDQFSPVPGFNMSPVYEANRLNSMFLYDAIDFQTYAKMYPKGIGCSEQVYYKIGNLNGLNLEINTLIMYVNGLIENIKIESEHEGMFNPIIRISPDMKFR